MKIWYVHPYAGGPGVGRYWRPFFLIQEWRKQGVEGVIFTARYHHLLEPDRPRRGRFPIHGVVYRIVPASRYRRGHLSRVLSMTTFALALPVIMIREYWAHGPPDLVVYSSPHPLGFPACWVLARLMGAKGFFEVRDIWPLSLVEIIGLSRRHPFVLLTGIIERLAYRCSDRVISLLPFAFDHMKARGLPSHKFVWIPNGVASAELGTNAAPRIDNEVLRKIRELHNCGRVVLVYTGAHGEPNALHRFIDAAILLKQEGFTRAAFILIGKGEQKQSLLERSCAEALDFIYFYDQLPRQEALAVVRSADAAFFVMHPLPIYRFGVSLNKLFDYMTCAVPIIGAYTARNDPIAEADCGISVPAGQPGAFAEAVKTLCAFTRDQREAMGRRGSSFVTRHHSYEVLAARYLSEYRARKVNIKQGDDCKNAKISNLDP